MARRTRSFSRDVESAINLAAQRHGMDPNTMRAIARVESSGNPKAQTGSYSGLFQLSPAEFRRGGGRGDIYDPVENAMAAAVNLRGYQTEFEKKFDRPASPAEIYMIHQQGWGGFNAHMANPDRPAWENMASTAEGRARGDAWSRQAISGNTLPGERRRYGDNITSRQFMDMWAERLGREGLEVGVPSPSENEALAFADRPGIAPRSEDEALAFADRPGVEVATPDVVASTIPSPIVQGVDGGLGKGGGGMNVGSIFGKGLAAAGKALSSSRISIPQFQDAGAQMAALDREGQTPVAIQARKPRKPPMIGGQGGAA